MTMNTCSLKVTTHFRYFEIQVDYQMKVNLILFLKNVCVYVSVYKTNDLFQFDFC